MESRRPAKRSFAELITATIAALCLLLLAGCASLVPQTMALRTAWPVGVPLRHRIEGVPLLTQQEFQCGPASLASTMARAGRPIAVDDLIRRVYLPARQGSLQVEMQAAPRAYGLVSYQLAPNMDDLLREVAADNPVLVLHDRGAWPFSRWHYTVVTGYDYPSGELILHDGTATEEAMPFTVFEYLWKKSDYWALVVLPPNRLPVTASDASALRSIEPLERLKGPQATTALHTAYRAYLDRWPSSLPGMIGLSNADYRLGKLAEAEAVLRRALAQKSKPEPAHVATLNNLAQVLSDQGRQEEALVFIERAMRLNTTSALQPELEATAASIKRKAAAERPAAH
jgi:tetratricopeptide (TPR) repeat protein